MPSSNCGCDDEIPGGGDWEARIKAKLAVCDICILLGVAPLARSDYVIKIEIETILQRQRSEDVQIYPIVLTPFPRAAAPASLLALNLRPPNGEPLSGLTRTSTRRGDGRPSRTRSSPYCDVARPA